MKRADMNWAFVSVIIVIMLVLIMATVIYKQKASASGVIEQGKNLAKVDSPVIQGGTRTGGRPSAVVETRAGADPQVRAAYAVASLGDLVYSCYLQYLDNDVEHHCGPLTIQAQTPNFEDDEIGWYLSNVKGSEAAKNDFMSSKSQSCGVGTITPGTYYACVDDEFGYSDLFITTSPSKSTCDC